MRLPSARDYAWGYCLSSIHVRLSYVLDLHEWLVLDLSLWISFLWKNILNGIWEIAVYLTMASLTYTFLCEIFFFFFKNKLMNYGFLFEPGHFQSTVKIRNGSFLHVKHSNKSFKCSSSFKIRTHTFCVHVDNSIMKIYFTNQRDGSVGKGACHQAWLPEFNPCKSETTRGDYRKCGLATCLPPPIDK